MERSTAEPKSEMAIMTPTVTKSEISRVMAAMGHRGGKIGGKISLLTMTSKERRKRASRAAKARWAKRKKR